MFQSCPLSLDSFFIEFFPLMLRTVEMTVGLTQQLKGTTDGFCLVSMEFVFPTDLPSLYRQKTHSFYMLYSGYFYSSVDYFHDVKF